MCARSRRKIYFLWFVAVASVLFPLGMVRAFTIRDYQQRIEPIILEQFQRVDKQLHLSQHLIIDILRRRDQLKPKYDFAIYSQKGAETFSDHFHRSRSNFFVSYKTPISPDLKRAIQVSEHYENVFEGNKRTIPDLGWQYVVEYKYASMRAYPWFDIDSVIGNDIKWQNMEFYKMTKANSDTDRVLCTNPSVDVAGLGLIISCTIPVYLNQVPYGFLGFDLDISESFKVLQKYLGEDFREFAFIIHRERGHILLKPTFFNYLGKHISNMNDIHYDTAKNVWEVNNKLYRGTSIPLNVPYTKIHLLVLKQISP